jgi:hypothetical protein
MRAPGDRVPEQEVKDMQQAEQLSAGTTRTAQIPRVALAVMLAATAVLATAGIGASLITQRPEVAGGAMPYVVDPALVEHRRGEQGANAAIPFVLDPALVEHRRGEQGANAAIPFVLDPALVEHRRGER